MRNIRNISGDSFVEKEMAHRLIIFVSSLLLYLLSMPRTVVLEDDGFFIIAATFNGVTHPPGYPLFIMLSHLFTWIPVGSMAFRVHLASAFFGAIACVAMMILVRTLNQERIYGYFAAFGLAISATFWSQAIIAEVYTLNVLLFLVLFILAIRCTQAEPEHQDIHIRWLAFCYGLALSNHWPLIMLSTPALFVLLWPLRIHIFRNSYRYLPLVLLGLLPYLWLVWRSHEAANISFYGPIQTIQDFWHYLSRQEYAALDYSPTAGLVDKIKFTGFVLQETARQFGYIGFVLVIAGFTWQWIRQPGRLVIAMSLAYLGSTVFIITLRSVDYDYFQRAAFQVYPLISYAICWIWAVMGLDLILRFCENGFAKRLDMILVKRVLVGLIVSSLFLYNYPVNNRREDILADQYGRLVLDSLKPGAIFYSNADNIDGPVNYLNKVEGYRADVTVFTGRYMEVEDTLYRPYQLTVRELRNLINHFVSISDTPVYFTNDFPNDYAVTRYGFYSEANRELPVNSEEVIINPIFPNYLSHWSGRYLEDHVWNWMHYNLLMADYCHLLLTAEKIQQDAQQYEMIQDMIDLTCSNFQGLLNRIEFELNEENINYSLINNLISQAQDLSDQAISKQDTARLSYYRGMYYYRQNDTQSAGVAFESSLRIWPHTENPSTEMLRRLGNND